ncbi:MAG: outer membrane beta-barrel protein, partial [Ignavibacteria bacterium]|nr:outer membrane beta-barrel protein [Ignavibacteria bacterium]
SYTKSRAENSTYDHDPLVNEYSNLDPKLSNVSGSAYSTERAGIGYNLRREELSLTAEVSYQIASLRNDQSFPSLKTMEKRFYNVLPTVTMKYEFSRQRKLMVLYRTSTNPPSISQLQDVIDNTNPILLRAGNPTLRQAYVHMLSGQYLAMDIERRSSFFLILTASCTHDYVGNSSWIADKDTLLPSGTRLNKGTRLTVPANLDGQWIMRPGLAFGFPVDAIKSHLSLNTSFAYTRKPGLVNGTMNVSNMYTLTQGLGLGSNIGEGVDFTMFYMANYNIFKNTLQPELDNKYFFHTASLKFDWIFWEGVAFRTTVTNTVNDGLSAGLNRNYTLCNVSLGKKLFQNNRGEIQLCVTDILNQNKSINRAVTEAYVEDMQNRVLGRYVVLMFTYTIR